MGNICEGQESSDDTDDKLIRDFISKRKKNDQPNRSDRQKLSDSFTREYQLTDRECPFCDSDARLWSNSYELVCESCAGVLNKEHYLIQRSLPDQEDRQREDRLEYNNSGRIVLPGGYFSAYDGDGIYG